MQGQEQTQKQRKQEREKHKSTSVILQSVTRRATNTTCTHTHTHITERAVKAFQHEHREHVCGEKRFYPRHAEHQKCEMGVNKLQKSLTQTRMSKYARKSLAGADHLH